MLVEIRIYVLGWVKEPILLFCFFGLLVHAKRMYSCSTFVARWRKRVALIITSLYGSTIVVWAPYRYDVNGKTASALSEARREATAVPIPLYRHPISTRIGSSPSRGQIHSPATTNPTKPKSSTATSISSPPFMTNPLAINYPSASHGA